MADQSKKSDVQLWEEFIAGNDRAFQAIYENHLQLLFSFGLHFTKDADLIQDCIHDLFVDLHKYRLKLKKTDNIKLYLFVALKRRIIKLLVKELKIKRIDSENLPFVYDLLDNDHEQEITNIKLKLIDKAMSSLSNRQREAIYLRFVSELSYEELSQVLNLNYQSARNLIFRGIEKLRNNCQGNSILILFSFLKK